jgi:Flp pilus assembly protein TadG
MRHRAGHSRRAAAAVELAICLPLMMFLFMVTIDWARLYYYDLMIANCARQGALWASDPVAQAQSPYATLSQAALAEYQNFSWPGSPPTVSSANGTDGNGNATVAVTVTWNIPQGQSGLFPTYAPGSPDPGFTMLSSLSRTVTMRMAP